MKTREELYADSKKYVWHLKIQNPGNGKTRFGNGFSLANNVIVSPILFFESSKVTIMGRRLNENDYSHRLIYRFGSKQRGLVVLQDENGPSLHFGTLAEDRDLGLDEVIYAISTYFPNQEEDGLFLAGHVAFPFLTSKNLTVKVSDGLCSKYMLPKGSGFTKSSNNRIIGNLINKKSLEKGERMKKLTTSGMEYLGSLYHTLPIIHCDKFPAFHPGVGGPVIDNAGMIIGILSGGIEPYTTVVTHASAVRTFVEGIWPAFEKRNHKKNEGKKKFTGNKEKDDDNDRKKKKQKTKSVEEREQKDDHNLGPVKQVSSSIKQQGLDGEATEPMIKELEEDREESQDPEVEFAIAGAVKECGGLEIILGMIQRLREDLKSNQEQLVQVLNLSILCCKIRDNRKALLKLGALSILLDTARHAFSVDAMEPAEGILLIVESLTLEANESDIIGITQNVLAVSNEETGSGEQAKKIVVMFLERLCHPSGLKKSNKQQRNNEMVARILPYLTYGEPAAMEALIQHFDTYLQNWSEFDQVQKQHEENPKDDSISENAMKQRFAVENFVRVSESLKTSSCGERLKDIILGKGITRVAVDHLRESFVFIGQTGFKSSAEWASYLKLPSVPLILSMLSGLSMGHLATQKCIDEGGILSLLHALEGVSGENEIGARAENLLDTLSAKEEKGDGFLAQKIDDLRHATRDEMRRRALKKREQLLQVVEVADPSTLGDMIGSYQKITQRRKGPKQALMVANNDDVA